MSSVQYQNIQRMAMTSPVKFSRSFILSCVPGKHYFDHTVPPLFSFTVTSQASTWRRWMPWAYKKRINNMLLENFLVILLSAALQMEHEPSSDQQSVCWACISLTLSCLNNTMCCAMYEWCCNDTACITMVMMEPQQRFMQAVVMLYNSDNGTHNFTYTLLLMTECAVQ